MDTIDYLDERDRPSIPLDMDDLLRKNESLHRRLHALGRKYDLACQALEEAREAPGYPANPLPFLRFPQEIRDQISTYALQAPLEACPQVSPVVRARNSDFQPPTPGLLLVNKQVSREAKNILYSQNTFSFSESQQMMEFVEQIGTESKDQIRTISIRVAYVSDSLRREPDVTFGNEPYNWAMALISAGFWSLTNLHVQAVNLIRLVDDISPMDLLMENVIKEILQCYSSNKAPKKLKLTGYDRNACKKFPQEWQVVTESEEDSHEEAEAENEEAENKEAEDEEAEDEEAEDEKAGAEWPQAEESNAESA